MTLSKTELQMLLEIAKQHDHIQELVLRLKKSRSQIFRILESLIDKNFIQRKNKQYIPHDQLHISLLLQLLLKHPQLVDIIPDSTIAVLTSCLAPKTIKQIAKETNLKEISVYKIIERCRKYSILRKSGTRYWTNDKVWIDLRIFLEAYKQHNEIIDSRVPLHATIYYKTSAEIIFSTPETQDATLTGFSAYKDYGIKLLSSINEYYLPKKKLTKEEVFIHSIYITRKDPSISNLIYLALFYAQHKKDLKKAADDPIIKNVIEVLQGKKITHYPTKEEIQDRAEVYDIKL